MAEIDVNAALASLDFSEGSSPAADPPASTEAQTSSPDPTPQASGPTDTESFTKLDPSTLPPELQEFYKSMQGDYTRKTQELAPLRAAIEQLGGDVDLERVVQAYTFADNLDRNPDFQRQVYEHLQQQFAEANGPAEPTAAEYENFVGDDDGEDSELPPALRSALTEMRTEFARFQQERAALQQERELTELATKLHAQENAIREANPKYSDEHIKAIYNLAATTGGDLVKAQESFEGMRGLFAQEMLAQKENIPDTRGPGVPVSAEKPHTFANMDEAHNAALAHFLAARNS